MLYELILVLTYCLSFGAIPRWPNLIHFKAVMSVDFNDGSFHEDISKVQAPTLNMIFCADTDFK